MLKVGVTGGMGSGKTLVCRIFSVLGIAVFKADEVSKGILNTDVSVRKALLGKFGNDILTENGAVDRHLLSKIVFADKNKLAYLNKLLHPKVFASFNKWCAYSKNAPYVVQEAAILFESGIWSHMDKVITVVCPLEDRISRIMKRDGLSRDEILSRMSNQTTDDYKTSRSQFVILNDASHLIIPQVIEVDKLLKEESGKKV